jgi:hypothetical protein
LGLHSKNTLSQKNNNNKNWINKQKLKYHI